MMIKRLFLLTTLLLTSCALPAPETSSLVSLPQTWRNASEPAQMASVPRTAAERASGSIASDEAWWTVLNDPTLDEWVRSALSDNPSVEQGRQRVAAARALARVAHTRAYPQVQGRVGGAQDASAQDSYLQIGVEMVWPLLLEAERDGIQWAARAQDESSQAALQTIRSVIAADVVRVYTQLNVARRQRAWANESAMLSARGADMQAVRQSLGLAPLSALVESRAEVRRARAHVAELSHQIDVSAQAMAVLLGRSAPDPAWLAPIARDDGQGDPQALNVAAVARAPLSDTGVDRLPALQLDRVPASLLTERPDVRQAQAEVYAAAAKLGLARARQYPRIALATSWVYAKNITNNTPRASLNGVPLIAPMIDIPLWDWGERAAQATAATHELRAAQAAYRARVLQAYAETEDALGTLDMARRLRGDAVQAVEETRQVMHAADEAARLRLADALQVQSARRGWLDAQEHAAQAEAVVVMAFARLHESLGSGVGQEVGASS